MKVLVAEDDAAIAEGLLRSLRAAGYAVEWARNGEEAEDALTASEFDVLILDLGLPKKSGMEVLRGLRARASRLPVLILTALDDLDTRVRGLDSGADDYLRKPFAFAELEARVRALVRRGAGDRPMTMTLGALTYDRVTRVAQIDARTVELSALESNLLELLLQRAGHLISRDQLSAQLGDWGEDVSAGAIEMYVGRLRRKLEPSGVRIVAVPGLGFSLERMP